MIRDNISFSRARRICRRWARRQTRPCRRPRRSSRPWPRKRAATNHRQRRRRQPRRPAMAPAVARTVVIHRSSNVTPALAARRRATHSPHTPHHNNPSVQNSTAGTYIFFFYWIVIMIMIIYINFKARYFIRSCNAIQSLSLKMKKNKKQKLVIIWSAVTWWIFAVPWTIVQLCGTECTE